MEREILVVEDDPDTRDGIVDLLLAHGYAVRCAATGLEALEALRAHPRIGLVLTDLNMPVMDGWVLLDQLRSRQARVPTLVFTSAPDCHGLPVDSVLEKPADSRALLERIAALLEPRARHPPIPGQSSSTPRHR